MGLDDFVDGDSSTSTETVTPDVNTTESDTTSTSSTDSEWNQKDQTGQFYRRSYKQTEDGNIVPRGPVGYETQDDFEETKTKDLKTTEINPKFWYAMYPHVLPEQTWSSGDRLSAIVYQSEDQSGVYRHRSVTCVVSVEKELRTIPREVIMLDTGEVTKQEALETLSERFGHTVEPTDMVTLHFFADWMGMAASVMATNNLDSVRTHQLEDIQKAFVWPMSLKRMSSYPEEGSWKTMTEW